MKFPTVEHLHILFPPGLFLHRVIPDWNFLSLFLLDTAYNWDKSTVIVFNTNFTLFILLHRSQ